jgi:ferric enterobactin receptor
MTRRNYLLSYQSVSGLLMLLLLLVNHRGFGQAGRGASVSAQIVDSSSSAALASSTIQVFRQGDKSVFRGLVADSSGRFTVALNAGSYYLSVKHLGYSTVTTRSFELTATQSLDLGTIRLKSVSKTLDEVVVQAQRSSMQLSLDKKIFNVGQDLANAGGSASDILSNIPSVSVDQEGNVKLRGSDNVRILIDGKPSGLVSIKGGSGLQQLQANMVDKVEIITNPSARYEAEGVGGVINIILKKEKQNGFNGSVEAVTGTPTNLGAAANFNYRHRRFNFFINYGINYRVQPYVSSLYQEVYERDTTFILKQENDGEVIGFNNNIRGGLDFFFTEKSVLTASYLYRRSKGQRETNIHYQDYLFDLSNPTGSIYRRQDEDETEPNSEYSLIYKRSFTRKGHELTAEVKHIDNWENSDQVFTQNGFKPDGSVDHSKNVVQLSVNDEFEKQWLFQLDYTKPIGTEGKFETGVRSSFRNMVNDYIVTQQDSAGGYYPLPGLDNIFLYDENIHAAYGIIGNKTNRFSYQAGLRAEWTDVKTTLKETNEINPRNYVNLFPSAHLTLELESENAMQLSYSRRVRRPFYNDLSPFMTYSDSRNYFSGNPDLEPEFSDVIELAHIKTFDKGSFTSSLYYRDTKGKITSIRLVDENGNSITQPENLVGEKALGAEFTAGYTPYKWWKLDFNANMFYSEIDGSNISAEYETNTFSWSARQTSRFMFKGNFDIQLRANYEAPQKTAQGERKGLFFADFSMSKDVFKGKGTVSFNVLDVFNSRRYRSTSEGTNFYTESDSQYRRRQINLSLSYRIRQSKAIAKPKLGEE